MLLKSIRLHNIRSYKDQEIRIPNGSVLLAGDIGSGKSTILLAIEFAIFGAKKGELPAYTLLRHGSKEGSVELRMGIENKDIIIKRTLKRSNDDIKQEAGYIIINGIKKEGTSEELRAITLDILGYPKDLVRKGKDLIYRYTVYTPQEEMKQILYEGNDVRLDTLRKVFNIDKYKRIRENSAIIIRFLRERKRHLDGFVLDLEYKKKEAEERKNEILEIDRIISGLMPKIAEVKGIISEKRSSISLLESEIAELNSLRKELSVADANLAHKIEQNNRLNDEVKKLESQIADIREYIGDKSLDKMESFPEKIGQKEKEIEEAEASYKNTLRKIKELEVKMEHCSETVRKIREIDICPVCQQKVDESHRHEVISREGRKQEELLELVKGCREEETNLEKIRLQLKKEIDFMAREQSHLNVLKVKFENLGEKQAAREEKLALKEKIKMEIGALNSKKAGLNAKAEKFSETEGKYKSVKREIDELLPQERFLELEKRKCEAEKESIRRFISGLEKEINEKQKARELLARISQLINWIDEFFVSLMSAMEKHVMVNIHSQFDGLFKNWFDMLMEDEAISVRVDEEFTPIIQQDGYETYIENLSGGERTSVALAYRLALNKVINDIVAEIKTKDIIMLDEPTDGFSTEQLDKVRDLLSQLNMGQVIIVSHESKIESFVQNIIRVEKRDSISVVI